MINFPKIRSDASFLESNFRLIFPKIEFFPLNLYKIKSFPNLEKIHIKSTSAKHWYLLKNLNKVLGTRLKWERKTKILPKNNKGKKLKAKHFEE